MEHSRILHTRRVSLLWVNRVDVALSSIVPSPKWLLRWVPSSVMPVPLAASEFDMTCIYQCQVLCWNISKSTKFLGQDSRCSLTIPLKLKRTLLPCNPWFNSRIYLCRQLYGSVLPRQYPGCPYHSACTDPSDHDHRSPNHDHHRSSYHNRCNPN